MAGRGSSDDHGNGKGAAKPPPPTRKRTPSSQSSVDTRSTNPASKPPTSPTSNTPSGSSPAGMRHHTSPHLPPPVAKSSISTASSPPAAQVSERAAAAQVRHDALLATFARKPIRPSFSCENGSIYQLCSTYTVHSSRGVRTNAYHPSVISWFAIDRPVLVERRGGNDDFKHASLPEGPLIGLGDEQAEMNENIDKRLTELPDSSIVGRREAERWDKEGMERLRELERRLQEMQDLRTTTIYCMVNVTDTVGMDLLKKKNRKCVLGRLIVHSRTVFTFLIFFLKLGSTFHSSPLLL